MVVAKQFLVNKELDIGAGELLERGPVGHLEAIVEANESLPHGRLEVGLNKGSR